jgi:hypothetical protein
MGALMSQTPAVVADKIRFKVEPRDIPAVKAARRLHLSLDEFRTKLPELLGRGFPPADPTTGMFYLPAIDQWMARRFDQSACNNSKNEQDIISSRIARL